ncbi:MAG: UDP-N-acetylmuramoyl-L-alanyl-D-glutamate--2,6-diaminopimelate ligase [Bacteroidales bacterium]|nr:UDP-N-acetylmuramoyl-L-alanyl-D-glutamate--2,6-diaminopimelate ligase [Bacteroidales bacterium]
MKKLRDILFKIDIIKVIGTTDIDIDNLAFDSRKAKQDSVYIAQKGTQVDGHEFISNAIFSGATVIVCEDLPVERTDSVNYIVVKSSQKALGLMASNYYGNPSSKLKLVGVTGTNGKTTIVTLLHDLFGQLGYSRGLLSTIVNKIDDVEIPSTHTTPDAININRLLSEMVEASVEYCFMEVSSHAIHQDRVSGLEFAGGLFTNITHDHLDYHLTFRDYLNAKKKFFDDLPKTAFALTNLDDKNGLVMQQNTKARKVTYALKSMADFKGKIIENHFDGLILNVNNRELWCRLVGEYNAYNLLAIYGAALELGQDVDEVLRLISNLKTAEGRFEMMRSDSGVVAIVDYAHTPDAVINVLNCISQLRTRNEKVITVIGAGGDRDTSKRPLMAKAAVQQSDIVILTSDNPRSENPERIIDDMKVGVDAASSRKILCITNREEAIKTSCALANSGDIILVAGKGHEKYQDINGVKYPFDDKEILAKALNIKK